MIAPVTQVEIIMSQGAFGAYEDEQPIVTALRIIGAGFGEDGEWSTKYGTNYENDVFLIKPFCWCDKPDCLWCMHGDDPNFDSRLQARFDTTDYFKYKDRLYYDPPNFWYKPSDFRLTWYKYIGRDMATNSETIPSDFLQSIFDTHPSGMSIADAVSLAIAQS